MSVFQGRDERIWRWTGTRIWQWINLMINGNKDEACDFSGWRRTVEPERIRAWLYICLLNDNWEWRVKEGSMWFYTTALNDKRCYKPPNGRDQFRHFDHSLGIKDGHTQNLGIELYLEYNSKTKKYNFSYLLQIIQCNFSYEKLQNYHVNSDHPFMSILSFYSYKYDLCVWTCVYI